MVEYVAWFVCRGPGKTVGDVALKLKPGLENSDKNALTRQGRMRAARQFKRDKNLHPCTKVTVEFQAVMSWADYNNT